jgi:hypothetical protein
MLRTPGVASNHFINCPLSNDSIVPANRNTIKQFLAARWFDRGKPVAASVGSVAASLREELLDPTLRPAAFVPGNKPDVARVAFRDFGFS